MILTWVNILQINSGLGRGSVNETFHFSLNSGGSRISILSSEGSRTPTRNGGCQPIIWTKFAGNCMKMKNIDPGRGRASKILLCRSTIAIITCFLFCSRGTTFGTGSVWRSWVHRQISHRLSSKVRTNNYVVNLSLFGLNHCLVFPFRGPKRFDRLRALQTKFYSIEWLNHYISSLKRRQGCHTFCEKSSTAFAGSGGGKGPNFL